MNGERKEVWRRTRAIIRAYPDLPPDEYKAVSDALRRAERLPDGVWRARAARLMLMDRSCTVDGAALECHVSARTVRRWNGAFILAVAKNMHWI